jgi:hypothetical protein
MSTSSQLPETPVERAEQPDEAQSVSLAAAAQVEVETLPYQFPGDGGSWRAAGQNPSRWLR